MPSSQEVLTPPTPRRRPGLRAVLAAAVLALVAWAVVARISADGQQEPAAAPASRTASTASPAQPLGPPPWVRYPTALEGRWVTEEAAGHVTLLISNAYLDIWQGIGQQQGRPLTRRTITVLGNRVYVRTLGDPGEVATYRWRISGERLTFELVEQTPKSPSLLAGLTFDRS